MSGSKLFDEAFPSNLVQVVKSIKRRNGDGSTSNHDQRFKVRKASPGDRYTTGIAAPQGAAMAPPTAAAPDATDQPSDQPGALGDPADAAVSVPDRITIQASEIPWPIGAGAVGGKTDPIPPDIRKRYDPANKPGRLMRPALGALPINLVEPGRKVLWGYPESELLDRLRAGQIVNIRSSGGENGVFYVKVETNDSYTHEAFLRFEGLIDPYVYLAWGKTYDLSRKKGDVSRRSVAAYEIAKAIGFDDLVPPTTMRGDDPVDVDAILTPELIERKRSFCESVAKVTGGDPKLMKAAFYGLCSVQFAPKELSPIHRQQWFLSMFGDGKPKDILNHLYDVLPDGVRKEFLRVAAFDFVLFSADRHWGDLAFRPETSSPIALFDNGISLPDPARIAFEITKDGQDYESGSTYGSVPMLWSDFSTLLALRGQEREIRDFSDIGFDVSTKIKTERATEVVRSLLEHNIPQLCIAGAMARMRMLGSQPQLVARDPLIAARYYAELVSSEKSQLSTLFSEVEEFVNLSMGKVMGGSYSFRNEMQKAVGEIGDESGH